MKFINNIYYMGVAILIFRFSAWFLYNKLRMNVAPGYFEVMGFAWARNGVSRLPGTFLDNYVWVMALFKIIKEKSVVIKTRNISVIVLCFLYAYIVYDSRSQQIAYLLSLVVFILIVSDTFKSKALDVVGAIAISPIIFRGNYLNKLVNTFSTSNADYGSSTQIRMMTLNTYQTLWIERGVWWGYGISNDGNYFNILDTHMVNQSDLGILSMLFQYGIIGFAIFISPFVRL
ncbi:O-antigen ligase family protein [Lactobacillus crispatus]|nr:O-antigen ligase family protein [Lactobacillus crispatus]